MNTLHHNALKIESIDWEIKGIVKEAIQVNKFNGDYFVTLLVTFKTDNYSIRVRRGIDYITRPIVTVLRNYNGEELKGKAVIGFLSMPKDQYPNHLTLNIKSIHNVRDEKEIQNSNGYSDKTQLKIAY